MNDRRRRRRQFDVELPVACSFEEKQEVTGQLFEHEKENERIVAQGNESRDSPDMLRKSNNVTKKVKINNKRKRLSGETLVCMGQNRFKLTVRPATYHCLGCKVAVRWNEPKVSGSS